MSTSSAAHLACGAKLPSVRLPATDGSTIDPRSLAGPAVLIIYPWTGRPGLPNPPNWDNIPGAHGSTPEIEGFRDLAPQFAELGVTILGLSLQTTDYQREMAKRLSVPFLILSDAGGAFSPAVGLPTFETGGEIYLQRLTLIVIAGAIEHMFFPVPDPAGHAEEVLLWLKARR